MGNVMYVVRADDRVGEIAPEDLEFARSLDELGNRDGALSPLDRPREMSEEAFNGYLADTFDKGEAAKVVSQAENHRWSAQMALQNIVTNRAVQARVAKMNDFKQKLNDLLPPSAEIRQWDNPQFGTARACAGEVPGDDHCFYVNDETPIMHAFLRAMIASETPTEALRSFIADKHGTKGAQIVSDYLRKGAVTVDLRASLHGRSIINSVRDLTYDAATKSLIATLGGGRAGDITIKFSDLSAMEVKVTITKVDEDGVTQSRPTTLTELPTDGY